MNRLTVRAAKPELTRIAGASGMHVSDSRFLTRLNRAVEELMNAGEWPGVVDRYRFSVYGGVITLPADLNRIMGIAVSGEPLQMVSAWYEFHQDGPGPQDSRSWVDNVLDRGEACTFQPIPGAVSSQIEVVTEIDERIDGVRPKIIFRGYGELGSWIRSEIDGVQADGVAVELAGDASDKKSVASVPFTSIESVIKPRTRGFVHVYSFDGTNRYHLASYAPNETLPSYRRYAVPFLDTAQTHKVVVRARKRFIAVANDDDFLTITNMGALELMIIAHQKRDADNIGEYWNRRKAAVNLLKDEAKAYRGNTPKPAITFAAGFGMGSIPHVQ